MRFRFTFLIVLLLAGLPWSASQADEKIPCFAQGQLPDGDSLAPLDAWIKNAESSQATRADDSFAAATEGGYKGLLLKYFARFWTNTDLAATNSELKTILTSTDPAVRREYALDDKWDLWLAPFLYRTYFHFSSKAQGDRAGRLTPELEQIVLDLLWDRAKDKNDFALSQMSTWWMTGSENHDLNAKVTALLTSQIFKNREGFRDRNYPDAGQGGGYGYWFHSIFGDSTDPGPQGGGSYADGKARGPEEHYAAWVAFFKDYIRERAKRGFFVEVGAPGYMKFTISFIQDMRDYSEDPELRDLAGKFLDAIWADWAIDQINGHRGGSRTRWVDVGTQDSMYVGGRFLLGASADALYANHAWYGLLASDYRLPRAVWALALRREAMGSFAFESRRPGEENPAVAWERPPGMERTLLCDTDSRFLRYSYITPAYILGTQMDHPGALHSHLSSANRWQGMLFGDQDASRIYPAGYLMGAEKDKATIQKSAYFRSLQSGNALIVQRARGWSQANPEWFPFYDPTPLQTGIQFGALGKQAVEEAGWIFVGAGDAWLAVRPLQTLEKNRTLVRGGPEAANAPQPKTASTPDDYTSEPASRPWRWVNDKSAILLSKPYSPVLMQAGLRSDFPDLASFQKYVLAGRVQLRKIVVEGHFNVRWYPSAPEPVVLDFPSANDQMPKIDGKYVNYSPSWLFRSPFLNSDYKSGLITIEQGDAKLVLDFNTKPQNQQ